MTEVVDKKNCCGCTACASVCSKNCINMESDEEGFLYPYFRRENCIYCNLCNEICPINKYLETITEQYSFLVQHKNETVLKESTSGGAFSAIAEVILNRNGIVFGAAFNTNIQVKHTYIESTNELYKFRNSKYVQSDLGECFRAAREFLEQGREVCFSGTPCQVEGLKSFLHKDYDALLLVDFVCRAVPSPLLWEMYKEYRGGNIKHVTFRNKTLYGYTYSQIAIETEFGTDYTGIESDTYMRAFFTNLCDRPSCYDCKFKKRYRISDITLWDCLDVSKFNKEFDNNKGVTRVLTHTEKGKQAINQIEPFCNVLEIPVEKAIENVKEMVKSVSINPLRDKFFEDLTSLPVDSLFDKYFPCTKKVKAERFVRKISAKFGIYSKVKTIANKVMRRS